VSVAGGSDRSPAQRPLLVTVKTFFDSETHITVTLSLTITYLLTEGNVKGVFDSETHLTVTLSLTITYTLFLVRISNVVSVAGGSDRSPAQRPLLVTVKASSIPKRTLQQYSH
jgi:hypothetical protein